MNLQYHIYEPNIKCPYCDKDNRDDDSTIAQNLEERVEFECDHCGRKFFAESRIVYNTYSDCVLNGEKHDMKQSESRSTVFNCENCHHTEVR